MAAETTEEVAKKAAKARTSFALMKVLFFTLTRNEKSSMTSSSVANVGPSETSR
jgi:hypothetical protein